MKYKILLILTLYYAANYAQLSIGGNPPSFEIQNLTQTIDTKIMRPINIDSLKIVDSLDLIGEEVKPYRFGFAIDVNFGLRNSGTWDTLSNGDKIWRLKIISPNAYSINFIYNNFNLPEGATFFIYNNDKSMVLGAFTSQNNNEHNVFSTDLVKGSEVILEYFEPVYASNGALNISKVIHGYRNTFENSAFLASVGCNIEINCSQGDAWCIEKHAVSLILVDNNTKWCTGCMINNARQDLTPYYLTANHCLRGDENTWIFRFQYWGATCNGPIGSYVSINGASVKANNSDTDFALLQLNVTPYSGLGITYAGWDRSSIPATKATAIHHPSDASGSIMKISIDNNPLIAVQWVNGALNHWRASFDDGVVQPGSSGSPLFNQNHRIVGNLHGNQNNQCSNDACFCTQPIGEYGRFDISWNGGGTPQTRLKDWLDPDNTGITTIGHTSPKIYSINRTLTSTLKFAAVNELQIEGNLNTINPFGGGFGFTPNFCQPNGVVYTTEPGSVVDYRARSITVKQETEFKPGSEVSLVAVNDVQCWENIVYGDYVNVFCITNASARLSNSSTNSNTSSSIENLNSNNNSLFTVQPNPNNGVFKLTLANNSELPKTIIIRDYQGKVVKTIANPSDYELAIDLQNLNNGLYIITANYSNVIMSKRIIKQ